MVESDIQRFAGGGPGPLIWEEKEARNKVKVTQATYGWHPLHLRATGAKVSTRSQVYSQAVSHGVIVQCTVLLNVLAHMGLQ